MDAVPIVSDMVDLSDRHKLLKLRFHSYLKKKGSVRFPVSVAFESFLLGRLRLELFRL
jgi:hypothetical protein